MNRDEEMAAELARLEETDLDDGHYARPRPAQGASQVYSVRIPVEALERLRRVAEASEVAPSALMREWVLERLDIESPRNVIPFRISLTRAQVASVADKEVRAHAAVR